MGCQHLVRRKTCAHLYTSILTEFGKFVSAGDIIRMMDVSMQAAVQAGTSALRSVRETQLVVACFSLETTTIFVFSSQRMVHCSAARRPTKGLSKEGAALAVVVVVSCLRVWALARSRRAT